MRAVNPWVRRDDGSVLVSTIIVMLVLTIGALVLSVVVVNTSGLVTATRSSAQSKAAADAGITAAIVGAATAPDVCTMTVPNETTPEYEVAVTCDPSAKRVTFTSTGHGPGGKVTKTTATYEYTASATPAGSAELVFFNSGTSTVYFTNNVMPQSDGSKATILFPGGGSFKCKTTIPGNVITAGSIQGESGCTIEGSVFVGGENPFGGKALYLNNNDNVKGSAVAVGDVLLGNPASITGTLTLPTTATLTARWSQLSGKPTTDAAIYEGKPGGIIWSPTLGEPVLEPWFDYSYSPTDWPGYDIRTLTATSTPYNCSNWKGKLGDGTSNTFWTSYISGLVKDTVIDARACKGGMDTDQGATSVATLGVNVVFIANAFTLGKLTITPRAGTQPSVWFVVPDTVDDNKPSCPVGDSANSWDYKIESDAIINVTVNAMLYTPCGVRIGQGGTWTGSMYAGNFQDGGGIKIFTHAMGLPGQWGLGPGAVSPSSSTALGSLIEARDIAP